MVLVYMAVRQIRVYETLSPSFRLAASHRCCHLRRRLECARRGSLAAKRKLMSRASPQQSSFGNEAQRLKPPNLTGCFLPLVPSDWAHALTTEGDCKCGN